MALLEIAVQSMSVLDWIAAGLIVWCVLAVAGALLIGRSVREADQQEARGQGVPDNLASILEADGRAAPRHGGP